ncbi:diuretic hormone class 2-like [Limulus polyphemus]|uniref:Diuretic hormone class 2-like n=1 Tax=Limulus polyphemus TaxID=6850 RepID=A0ABM1TMK2_LIMPO|nr:diuretic hormone class 2-like [Limulus polyphemus]
MVKLFSAILFSFTLLRCLYDVRATGANARSRRSFVNNDNPSEVLDILADLRSNLLKGNEMSSEKRGLDLGLSRGFSGSQAAKHLMGLAAANFAGGPGRRRRDVDQNQ